MNAIAPDETLVMEGEDQRTIYDEFGILVQRKSSRDKWINSKRIINGVTIDLERHWTKDYIAALQETGACIRQNEMNDVMFVNGVQMNDARESVIMNRLRDIGLAGEIRMKDAMNEMGHTNRFHPIKNYLDALPAWDEVDRLNEFLGYMTFDGNPDIARTFMKKWLIGAIAKIYDNSQTYMLVLDGKQGIGKSYLARWFCSCLPDLFLESPIKPDDKDSLIRLMSYWVWEVGELQATTRKSDVEALKDFITHRTVTVRLPFAKRDISRPTTANLIGTINENGGGFLADTTGNRRFAIVKLGGINWQYTALDIHMIWAQVLAMYRSGQTSQLAPEETAEQSAINEKYHVMNPAIEYFCGRYEINPLSPAYVSMKDILGQLQNDGLTGSQHSHTINLAAYLQSKGAIKKSTNRGMVYQGVVMTHPNDNAIK